MFIGKEIEVVFIEPCNQYVKYYSNYTLKDKLVSKKGEKDYHCYFLDGKVHMIPYHNIKEIISEEKDISIEDYKYKWLKDFTEL